ncbi:MAG: MogA/MoaB family molybdenum cofactor biosynthesis protein [Ardenticatenaceae bacterium]|nr:MogA/MoaB family molybdenum cofactor biosynthesis protein [Ardenticatenaceae bacterium]
MSSPEISVAILTVSDRVTRGESEDQSGPVIAEVIAAGLPGAHVVATEVVPDEIPAIQATLRRWADDDDVDLILTTGGTGFAPRDRTPEATKPLLDREAPGLVVAMLLASLQMTPHAMLSRPAAGMRGQTLIINLPGSPKAVREHLLTLLPALPHGLELLRGAPGAAGRHLAPPPRLV